MKASARPRHVPPRRRGLAVAGLRAPPRCAPTRPHFSRVVSSLARVR